MKLLCLSLCIGVVGCSSNNDNNSGDVETEFAINGSATSLNGVAAPFFLSLSAGPGFYGQYVIEFFDSAVTCADANTNTNTTITITTTQMFADEDPETDITTLSPGAIPVIDGDSMEAFDLPTRTTAQISTTVDGNGTADVMAGTVTIQSFDDSNISGTFSATGTINDNPATFTGGFQMPICRQ